MFQTLGDYMFVSNSGLSYSFYDFVFAKIKRLKIYPQNEESVTHPAKIYLPTLQVFRDSTPQDNKRR